MSARLDLDAVDRRINARSDELVAAWKPDVGWDERFARADAFRARMVEVRTQFGEGKWLLRDLVFVPSAASDDIGEEWAAIALPNYSARIRRLVGSIARADSTLVELAAAAFARESGRDPATSDDLTSSVFATPFRDRLTGSPVTFARDENGRLVAAGRSSN